METHPNSIKSFHKTLEEIVANCLLEQSHPHAGGSHSLYCIRLNTHVSLCRMIECSLYEQCEPKMDQIC